MVLRSTDLAPLRSDAASRAGSVAVALELTGSHSAARVRQIKLIAEQRSFLN
jgi:hypothetical protein